MSRYTLVTNRAVFLPGSDIIVSVENSDPPRLQIHTESAPHWRSTLRRAATCAALVCLVGGCQPSPEALMQRAQELESQQNLPAAIEALRTAVEGRPDSAQARLQLGLLQAKI